MFQLPDFETCLWIVWALSCLGLIGLAAAAMWKNADNCDFSIELDRSPHAWDEAR